ncbi:MAG: hypothetical protein H6896_08800 [Rhodovulum sp.]|nr:hypothetical protein [Paracoccaceae bacterium]MCC0067093.1 hypothetical protein [Rhodovulum sp.]
MGATVGIKSACTDLQSSRFLNEINASALKRYQDKAGTPSEPDTPANSPPAKENAVAAGPRNGAEIAHETGRFHGAQDSTAPALGKAKSRDAGSETADDYGRVTVRIGSRVRIIRCRNNLQFIAQRRVRGDAQRPWRSFWFFTTRQDAARLCVAFRAAALALFDHIELPRAAK